MKRNTFIQKIAMVTQYVNRDGAKGGEGNGKGWASKGRGKGGG